MRKSILAILMGSNSGLPALEAALEVLRKVDIT